MKITYDAEVDVLYIQFVEATVTTEHLAEGIAADYGHLGYTRLMLSEVTSWFAKL